MLAGSEVLYIDQLRGSRLGQYAIDVVMGPAHANPRTAPPQARRSLACRGRQTA